MRNRAEQGDARGTAEGVRRSRSRPCAFRRAPCASRQGITLFETVVALTIVGLTSVAAMAAVGTELRAAERARRALEAEALATQRVLQLDLLTDEELRFLPDSIEDGRFDPPLDGYRWHTEVRPFETEPGVYDVSVRVSWTDGAYALHTRAFRRPPVLAR